MPMNPIGFWHDSGDGAALDTTIVAATKEVFHSGWTPHVNGTGFDAGSDWWSYAGTFGSIGSNGYTDGASNSRTVTSCYQDDAPDSIQFTLSGTGIADTDDTFVSIEIDGVEHLRSDRASYISDNTDGGTTWTWNGTTPTWSSSTSFKVTI